jgi:pyrrolidone-carboxylate peptidase
VTRLAEALGATCSDDAGGYVCNAWLHRVASTLAVPVGFVHVPAEGLPPDRLLHGLSALLERIG